MNIARQSTQRPEQKKIGRKFMSIIKGLMIGAGLLLGAAGMAQSITPLDQPRPLPGVRPSPETIRAWQSRKFGMFIHFGLYSTAGGTWQGRKVDNGYSEQIMANAPIAKADYEKLAQRFD